MADKTHSVIDYDHFEEFRDPQTYDIECDDFTEDQAIIESWARKTGGPLLDLACGTGRMAIHLADQGYKVTGVDIIPEMIEHGRKKAAARDVSIEWVVADACDFHLNRQFPFIFMLMNAFQFVLTREGQESMFACIREHLLPKGYFLFETRNPSPRNLFEVRYPDGERFALPKGGELITSEEQSYDPLTQIQHYTRQLTVVQADGAVQKKTLRTALRYVFPQEMEALLHYNGFEIHTSYGSWQGDPFTAESRSMIYICQMRS